MSSTIAQQTEATSLASKFVNVHGSDMHYFEAGRGDPVLFLHSIPVSGYVWRKVIPYLAPYAHCIAVDLIGMGKSAKPDIDYTVFDHIKYIEGFIQALNLEKLTLIMHGWGSIIGIDYAMRHEKNIKGLALYEAHINLANNWEDLSLPVQQLGAMLVNKKASYKAIVENNYFITKILQGSTLQNLSNEEFSYYSEPFKTIESRKVLWQFVQDLPFGEQGSAKVKALIKNYVEKLQVSQLPKLLLYSIPGFITTVENLQWCKAHFPNLTLKDLDMALHFAQEYAPERFGNALLDWYKTL